MTLILLIFLVFTLLSILDLAAIMSALQERPIWNKAITDESIITKVREVSSIYSVSTAVMSNQFYFGKLGGILVHYHINDIPVFRFSPAHYQINRIIKEKRK